MQGPVKIEVADRLNRNLGLFQAGSAVTIDVVTPAGKRGKFKTIFVGYVPKDYVLIQFPEAYKLGSFAQYIAQGTNITVRGLIEGHEGSIVAFASPIRQTLHVPSRLMVLEFPKEVSLQALRSSIRIDTSIDAKIKIKDDYWQAQIVDLSIKGCQIQISNGESLLLNKEQEVQVIVENFRGLNNLNINAQICNSKNLSEGLSVGVQFEQQDKTKQEVTSLLHHAITIDDI